MSRAHSGSDNQNYKAPNPIGLWAVHNGCPNETKIVLPNVFLFDPIFELSFDLVAIRQL
jgi:hypothetical protein